MMLMLVIQFSFVVNILQPVLIYHSSPFDALNRKIIKVVVIVVPRVCACLNWVTKSSQQQTDCCHEVGYLWLVQHSNASWGYIRRSSVVVMTIVVTSPVVFNVHTAEMRTKMQYNAKTGFDDPKIPKSAAYRRSHETHAWTNNCH